MLIGHCRGGALLEEKVVLGFIVLGVTVVAFVGPLEVPAAGFQGFVVLFHAVFEANVLFHAVFEAL